jgi:ligand-binding sensor domain-containing protein
MVIFYLHYRARVKISMHLFFICTTFIGLFSFFSGMSSSDTLHYTIDDGLPTNTIYKITQSRDGFIWLATDVGVVRFDGKYFEVYGMKHGLNANEVLWISCDKDNKVLMSPYQTGICYFDKGFIYNKQGDTELTKLVYTANTNPPCLKTFSSKFKGSFVSAGDSLFQYIDNVVHFILASEKKLLYERQDSTLVILTDSFSYCYKNRILEKRNLNKSVIDILKSQRGTNQAIALGTSIYLVGDSEVCRLRDYKHELHLEKKQFFQGLSFTNVFGFGINGKILVSDQFNRILTLDTCLCRNPLIDFPHPANAFFQDEDSNTWIGTPNNGLYLLPRNTRQYTTETLWDKNTTALYVDTFKRLWLGMSNGEVKCIDKNRIVFSARLDAGQIRCVYYHSASKKLFVVGDGSVSIWKEGKPGKFTLSKTLPGIAAKDLTVTPKGEVLIATAGGVIQYSGDSSSYSFLRTRYTAISATANGIYLGTNHGLIFTSDLQETTDIALHQPRLQYRIVKTCALPDSMLWVALANNTLLAIKKKRIAGEISWSTEPGFSCNVIKNIRPGKNHDVWVCTDNGLFRIKYLPKGDSISIRDIRHFSIDDGLLSNFINDVFVADSYACIASPKGIVQIRYDVPEPKTKLGINIIAVTINGKDNTLLPSYVLRYGQDDIEIRFTALHFGHSMNIYYKYMLEGHDQTWRSGTVNKVQYRALPHGSYTFKVMACLESSSLTSTVAAVSVKIRPPIYLTSWFIALMLMLFIGLISLLNFAWNRRVNRKQREKQELRRTMYDLELKALRAQMNPHFIFNSLTSIQAYINQSDKENSNRYLSKFAKLIRQTLEISGTPRIYVRDEIVYLENFMALEKMRFIKKFEYSIWSAPEIRDAEILPMMIQPFIENAILHGLLPKNDESAQLIITFKKDNMRLRVEIDDNGIGRSAAAELKRSVRLDHKSTGMQVTMSRINAYNQLYIGKIFADVTDKYDSEGIALGTRVTLYFPLQQENI